MPIVPIAATALTVGSALYSGYQGQQAQKKADKATSAYGAITAKSADVMKKQYELYKGRYVPLENMFVQEASEQVPDRQADYARVAGSTAYSQQLGQLGQGNVGQGDFYNQLNVGSSQFAPEASLGAYQGAEQERTDLMNRQMQAVSFGKQIPGQVLSGMQSRAGARLSASQQQGQLAQGYGQSALGLPAAMLNAYSGGMRAGAV